MTWSIPPLSEERQRFDDLGIDKGARVYIGPTAKNLWRVASVFTLSGGPPSTLHVRVISENTGQVRTIFSWQITRVHERSPE